MTKTANVSDSRSRGNSISLQREQENSKELMEQIAEQIAIQQTNNTQFGQLPALQPRKERLKDPFPCVKR